MTSPFESLSTALHEALAHAKGEPVGTIWQIETGVPDVRAIRAQTGLSQAEFARSIGVKKATLVNWEQSRRTPDGPARVLLALIAREPGIVQWMLA